MLNTSEVSPHEFMESAIKQNSTSLIFIHSHHLSNPEPNKSDKEVTKNLVYARSIIRINVLDHIVIGNNTHFSFASDGQVEEYETAILNLRTRGTSKVTRQQD